MIGVMSERVDGSTNVGHGSDIIQSHEEVSGNLKDGGRDAVRGGRGRRGKTV